MRYKVLYTAYWRVDYLEGSDRLGGRGEISRKEVRGIFVRPVCDAFALRASLWWADASCEHKGWKKALDSIYVPTMRIAS